MLAVSQRCEDLGLVVADQRLGDLGDHPRPRLDAIGVRREARIGVELGEAERVAEALPMLIAGDADEDLVVISRLEDLIDAPAAATHRHRLHFLAHDRAAGHVLAHHEDGRFEERRFDELPLPVRSRSRRAARMAITAIAPPMMSTTEVPARSGWPGGPGHIGKAAHELHDLVERRAVLVGAGEEALERAIDEARVDGRQRGVAAAEPIHRARREILDDDVGVRRPGGAAGRARPCS